MEAGFNSRAAGQFRVAESAAAEQEQFGLARIECGEHGADMFLLFGGGADLLGVGSAGRRVRQPLVPGAAEAAAQFVQTGADRGTVQPAARLFTLRPRSPPVFPKYFDGEFFGTAGVAGDTGDDASQRRVMGVEDRFEIERTLGSLHRGNRFAACVHDTLTPAGTGL